MFKQIPASEVKVIPQDNSCVDHQSKPHIELSGNKMTINCCCDQLCNNCINLAKELIQLLELNTNF